ncbi:MAG TPA: LCP family protein, partial [Candidatus Babeliales bacterium]|nr:LCP family protein [Candidatus Babeliales bacterium]
MAKKNTKNSVQTGRNLPGSYSSYVPNTAGSTDKKLNGRTGKYDLDKKPSRWRRTASLLLLSVFLFGLFIVFWDVRNISSAEKKMFGTGNVLELINASSLKGEERGRINLLLVGYSVDDPGHQGASLTDSLILLSMSPTKHTGFMLSIPRDLYVKIPGYGYGKINEAYKDGGISLLEEVVADNFQTPIDYYALVNYSSVRQTVDALGGITVNVNSPEGKLYDPNKDWITGGPLVDLANGAHQMNGEQALDFTRARGDPTPYGIPIGFAQSDFQRTADQRQVLTAIKNKMNWKLILNPRKNYQILNAVASNIKTDITASEIRG